LKKRAGKSAGSKHAAARRGFRVRVQRAGK
jgi:hypothetical protein